MIPVSLEINNFFSHKHSYIDFSEFNSALLVGNINGDYKASNGSGKSVLFESILWCMFNKSRASTMDDIIYWGESACKVDFIFNHENETYRIVRERSRVSSHSNVHFLRKGENEQWIDISGSTSSLTNSEIESTIKLDYKTFINSAYFRQNDISEFAEADPSRKKEILKSILDLSKWDKYEKNIKDVIREEKLKGKILQSKIENYEKIKEEFESFKIQLQEFTRQRKSSKEEQENLSRLTMSMRNSYSEIKQGMDTDSWDRLVARLNELKSISPSLKNEFEYTQTEFESLKKKYDFIKATIHANEMNISEITFDPEIDKKLLESTNQAIDLKAKITSTTKSLSKSRSMEINKEHCYVCKQDITAELYDHLVEEHEREISLLDTELVSFKNQLLVLNSKNQDLEKTKKENDRYQKLCEENAIHKERIVSMEKEISIFNEKLKIAETKLKDNSNDIASINEALASLKNDSFNKLRKDIEENENKLTTLSKDIDNLNIKIGILMEKTSSMEHLIQEMEIDRKKVFEHEKEIYLLTKTAKMLGKNGIQTILLNAVIEDLEATSNDILGDICHDSFVIYLDTQRVGSDGVTIIDTLDLRVKKDGITQSFQSLSGGEQFRASLALRIALSEISSRHGGSKLEFLLLDEIDSPLDRNGKESLFLSVIKSLEERYKILVITHDDTLKEKFTDVLDVSKINGESTVEYISM